MALTIALFEKMRLDVILAAPTGRAAKRLSELSGRDAQTVHRLLGATISEDGESVIFKKNLLHPLECDAVIIDESAAGGYASQLPARYGRRCRSASVSRPW